MICSVNEGEFVTETDEITDSTSTETFVQLTVRIFFNTLHPHRGVLEILTDGDGIDLSFYNDCRILAAKQVNYLTNFRVFDSQPPLVFLILLQKKFQLAADW